MIGEANQVVILAGGRGTRLSEYTHSIPKPMVPIKGDPIIYHIINIYKNFGLSNFLIATGYKENLIKNYFKNLNDKSINIKCINTGLKTMTGGRILRLKKYIQNNNFFLTYGDGVANVDLEKLYNFHKQKKSYLTVTAVRPPARFGYMKIDRTKKVKIFTEKKQINEGWINGGFFVCNKKIFEFIDNDSTYFEKEPMTRISMLNKLYAYKHKGFWQCMDTFRDNKFLDDT